MGDEFVVVQATECAVCQRIFDLAGEHGQLRTMGLDINQGYASSVRISSWVGSSTTKSMRPCILSKWPGCSSRGGPSLRLCPSSRPAPPNGDTPKRPENGEQPAGMLGSAARCGSYARPRRRRSATDRLLPGYSGGGSIGRYSGSSRLPANSA